MLRLASRQTMCFSHRVVVVEKGVRGGLRLYWEQKYRISGGVWRKLCQLERWNPSGIRAFVWGGLKKEKENISHNPQNRKTKLSWRRASNLGSKFTSPPCHSQKMGSSASFSDSHWRAWTSPINLPLNPRIYHKRGDKVGMAIRDNLGKC